MPSLLVRDVMHRNVIIASEDITMRDITRMMVDNHVGSVIIKKNEDVIGIVTENDVLKMVARGEDFDSILAGDVMTRYVLYATPETSLERAVAMMIENKIKKLPVLSDDKLVGIVTSTDISEVAPGIIKDLKHMMKSQ